MDLEEDNPAQLKAENKKLRKELRTLVIDKNLMEHKLYRAFHKLLQTKKRKIRELHREVKRLKGEDVGDDSEEDVGKGNYHCVTCRCNRRSRVKLVTIEDDETEAVNGRGQEAANDDEESDTQDPFAGGYSDETDMDEESASKSTSATTSPSKTVVVSCHEPSGVNSMESSSSHSSSSKKPKVAEESAACISTSKDSSRPDSTAANSNKNQQVPVLEPEELRNSEKSSSEDLDKLVEEFCA